MVGLVSIQYYWIQNSIELRNAQFSFSVRAALTRITNQLEVIEARERLEKQGVSKNWLRNADPVLIESLMKQRTTLVDTVWVEQDGERKGVEITSDHFSGVIQNNDHSTSEPELWNSQDPTASESNNLMSPEQTSAKPMQLLQELFSGYLSLDLRKPIHERIDKQLLDSLIYAELEERGIKTQYEFAVFNVFEQPVVASTGDKDMLSEIFELGYRTRLFPNDFFQELNYLKIYFPNQRNYLVGTMWEVLFIAGLFMLVIVIAFTYSIRTILRQKKLSEIKNDFINNMTHELKTPISTISLACEALADPDINHNGSRAGNFIGMIRDENKRLGVLVENVLRSAVIDRGEVALKPESINMQELIEEVNHNMIIQVKRRGGELHTEFKATNHVIEGDRIHLTNVLYNLIDNALKYTPADPEITITTRNKGKCLVVSVKDNGIGISREHHKKIFDKLYRVPTGNVHNVKGFGLGLSYVKNIAEKHRGKVTVSSDTNKGSTFSLYIPHRYEIEE